MQDRHWIRGLQFSTANMEIHTCGENEIRLSCSTLEEIEEVIQIL